MNAKTLKILSMLATVVSVGATIFIQFVGKKEMENTVAEKVAEAFAKGAGS